MIVYTPIFYCAELQLAFNDKITREVADTLQKDSQEGRPGKYILGKHTPARAGRSDRLMAY